MLLLQSSDIRLRMHQLAAHCSSLDVMTYGVGHPQNIISWLNRVGKCRLIVGGFRGEMESRVRALVTVMQRRPSVEIRYLDGSHIKLVISYGSPKVVILGSANLGSGSSHELAIESPSNKIRLQCEGIFGRLWHNSESIKPLDLIAAKTVLASSVFEVPRET